MIKLKVIFDDGTVIRLIAPANVDPWRYAHERLNGVIVKVVVE